MGGALQGEAGGTAAFPLLEYLACFTAGDVFGVLSLLEIQPGAPQFLRSFIFIFFSPA